LKLSTGEANIHQLLKKTKQIEKKFFEMSIQNSPKIGDTLFLLHRKVLVIKVYTLFGFVIVRYLDEMKEFCVDICALSREPDYTNSISLKLLRRKCCE
jgi:hypothetical protein